MKNYAWLVCVWVFSLGLLTFLPVTRWLPVFQPARENQNRFHEKGSRR
jgi:hypothetical protein